MRKPNNDSKLMRTIIVVDYDPAWPEVFQQLLSKVWPLVSDFALSVEHVGSTAVPGLSAKPIIDLSIVVSSEAEIRLAIERLATIGYLHRGNLGIEGREAFHSPDGLPPHHLYVCPQGGLGLQNQLAVRDFLRLHRETAQAYGELKKRLAREFPHDIESYIDGKTDFLLDVLQRAGLPPDRLKAIEIANRKR
jgi:GrpB-like predicted nucleotidyltransferase (UPF0157 family)